jgi:hypothetical protein
MPQRRIIAPLEHYCHSWWRVTAKTDSFGSWSFGLKGNSKAREGLVENTALRRKSLFRKFSLIILETVDGRVEAEPVAELRKGSDSSALKNFFAEGGSSTHGSFGESWRDSSK